MTLTSTDAVSPAATHTESRMALIDKDLRVRPLTPQEVEVSQSLEDVWRRLAPRSVEAISANTDGLYDFFSHDNSLYVLAIEQDNTSELVDPELHELFNPYLSNDYDPFVIGIAYITSTSIPGTVGIGVALHENLRGKGLGARAVRLLTRWAFVDLGCHRVQGNVAQYGDDLADAAAQLFISLGFSHEGTARRALFCPSPITDSPACAPIRPASNSTNGEWQDVTTYAILDTDWCLRNSASQPEIARGVKALWDDMFARHARERRAMLLVEERDMARRGRTLCAASTETITLTESTYEQGSETSAYSDAESVVGRETYGGHRLPDGGEDESINSAEGSPRFSSVHFTRRSNSPSPPLSTGASGLPPHAHHTQPWAALLHASSYRTAASDGAGSDYEMFSSAGPSQHGSDVDLISRADDVPRSPSVLSTAPSTLNWEIVENADDGWNAI